MEKRNDLADCGSCGEGMKRSVEMFRPSTFEEYFDEGLNSDVYTERHRQSIMKQQGVIESGDTVHGGRNFDSKLPGLVKKQKVKGKVWTPAPTASGAVVSTVDDSGKIVETHTVDSLPTAGK
tara:strand:- start:11048 stop:11413 length:366 start_codon:yes stop_codon:yes gene_type:complete